MYTTIHHVNKIVLEVPKRRKTEDGEYYYSQFLRIFDDKKNEYEITIFNDKDKPVEFVNENKEIHPVFREIINGQIVVRR